MPGLGFIVQGLGFRVEGLGSLNRCSRNPENLFMGRVDFVYTYVRQTPKPISPA